MYRISRRSFLHTSLLSTALLGVARCASTAVTPALIVINTQAVVNGLVGALNRAEQSSPSLAKTLGKLPQDLTLAQRALAGLQAGMPAAAGAPLEQQIEGYINDAVSVAATLPLPAPLPAAFQAAVVLLPGLEAFANQYLPTAAAPAQLAVARARFSSTLTPAAARSLLQSFARS